MRFGKYVVWIVPMFLVCSVAVATSKQWSEDINGDGVKEVMYESRHEPGGSAGETYGLTIKRKGKIIFLHGSMERDIYIIRDVSKGYPGKEIIVCDSIFDKGTYNNNDYIIDWYGWDSTVNRYVIYSRNYPKTRRLNNHKKALSEFKLSGEEGIIYKGIKTIRSFLAYAKEGKWDACANLISDSVQSRSARGHPVKEAKQYTKDLKKINFCPIPMSISLTYKKDLPAHLKNQNDRMEMTWQIPGDNFCNRQENPVLLPELRVHTDQKTGKIIFFAVCYGD